MRCTLAVLLCTLMLLGQAQRSDTLPHIRSSNEWFIKFSPLSFVESDGGVAFTGEYVLEKSKLGLQLEVQPVFFSIGNSGENGNGWQIPVNTLKSGSPVGIKLRPEIRLYLRGVGDFNRNNNAFMTRRSARRYQEDRRTYIALDFLYKYTSQERLGQFDVFNGGTTPVFRQQAIYTDIKHVYGTDFKVGSIQPLFSSDHWFCEVFLGFGLRYKKFSYKDLPVGVAEPSRRRVLFWGRNNNVQNNLGLTRNEVSVPAGLKIIYKF